MDRSLTPPVMGACVLLGASLVVYWPAVSSLLALWTTRGAYDHGPIALGGAMWIASRRAIVGKPPPPALAGATVAILLPATAAWSLAWLANLAAMQTTLWAGIVVVSVMALGGFGMVRQLALPFALVGLAIPVWEYAVPFLTPLAVLGSTAGVLATGIPAMVEANNIIIPSGIFAIEGGCSGLRYLLAATTLAILAGELASADRRGRWLLAAIAAVSAVVGNWLRILVVVAAGYATDMRHPLVEDHAWLGWVIFAALVIPALLVAMTRVGTSAPSDARRGLVLPHRSAASVAIIAIVLFAVPVAARVIDAARHDDARVSLKLPTATGGWFGPAATRCPWLPSAGAPGAAAEVCVTYESAESGPVFVSIVAYARQTEGQELVGRDGARPEGEWSVSSRAFMETSVGQPATVVASTVADERGPDWRMWHWYTIGSATTHRPWQVKLGAALAFATPRLAALTVIAAPCAGDCERADEQLSRYLHAHRELTKTLALADSATPRADAHGLSRRGQLGEP